MKGSNTFVAVLKPERGPKRPREIGFRGVNLYVEVPARVSARFGLHRNVPVRATLGGQRFRATLVPRAGGRHILYVNIAMQRAARAKLGEQVSIRLASDVASRMPRMHPALSEALRQRPALAAKWRGLAPSRRKEILRYLCAMKTGEAAERNVRRVLRFLSGRSVRHHALSRR